MIVFAVERFDDVLLELPPIWQRHYDEIAEDKDRVPLAPDIERYVALDQAGMLHILTARRDGVLVGYIFSIVQYGLHYRTTLMASLDLYWLEHGYRGGRTALRLFRELERTLTARGVVKLFGNLKVARDQTSRLFEHLGWREAERLYVKTLGI